MKDEKPLKTKRLGLFHQLADYVVALGFLILISRSAYPYILGALGFVALFNSSTTPGPLSAYRFMPRKLHNALDLALVLGALIAGSIGSQSVSNRSSLFALAILQGFIIYLARVTKHARL
ncbi:MAG: hypothetical protein WCG49_01195 [Actinomycetes bacterium]